MKTLRVLLVEDSALFCRALANILGGNKTFSVDVCSSSTFLKKTKNIVPHAVVIDAVTWAAGLKALVDAVQETAENTPVILLGREDLLERHFEALRAGAVGFVKQTAAPQLLFKVIRAVAMGGVWFEKDLFRKIFLQNPLPITLHRKLYLSQKDQQIITLVASGKTNKEIGAVVGLSERTIKARLSNLFQKIGVPNRSSLTSYAIVHGVKPLNPAVGS